jgi:copper chaperone CopZ
MTNPKEARMNSTITYDVPGMTCGHCEAAISAEVCALPGVEAVAVNLESKRVAVSGDGLDDNAIRAAIHAAGYEAAQS